MPLPPLALPPCPAVRITGDVVVDPQAVLAPGVVLWAEAGASIRIAAGTCVGMGSVIHAHGGAIVIGEGVNLGAGVLLIGQVTIEPHACIGTTATIMNTTVPAGAVVAAGSLIGDTSRRWQPEPQPTADPWQEATPEPAVATTNNGIPENPPAPTNETTTAAKTGVVYGQTYVSQMFAKMFRTERLTNEPSESS